MSPWLRTTRDAVWRLVIAVLMGCLALLVVGGPRWFVLRRLIGVAFFADLYGSIALLWLAAVSHRLGRRVDGLAHTAFFGAAAGIFFVQHLTDAARAWTVAVVAATLLPAIVPPNRARMVAVGSVVALLLYTIVTWSDHGTRDSFWLLPVATLFVAPFFAYSWWLVRREADGKFSRPTGLTLALVVLGVLELIGVPTSFVMFTATVARSPGWSIH